MFNIFESMFDVSTYRHSYVKIYHGYGHTNDLVVYGHVFLNKPRTRIRYTNNIFINIIHLFRLFSLQPASRAPVELQWRNQVITSHTESDGFFKFEWKSDQEVNAGWHEVTVRFIDQDRHILAASQGRIYVPHKAQFAVISDIDDTILISHSATIFRRLRVLFSKNPRTRKSFHRVTEHYHLLQSSNTAVSGSNPFFYVSSSEWNLYDDLLEFFRHNQLPDGVFLLNAIKNWRQLFKTGKTKHEAKLLKIIRILEVFPHQRFILMGDNSQRDPAIYQAITRKYAPQIFAVYIHNIILENEFKTTEILRDIRAAGIYTCQFINNTEAIAFSREIGILPKYDR